MQRPPVTPDMRARAVTMPNNWLHVVDPAHVTSDGDAVIGRYLVDARGRITDDWVPNPRYRPVEPVNDLEGAMMLAHSGELPPPDLVLAVLAAELILPADPARQLGKHLVIRTQDDGKRVVDAFASSRALPADWPPHWHRFPGAELAIVLDRLDVDVSLHLYGPGSLQHRITAHALVTGLLTAVA